MLTFAQVPPIVAPPPALGISRKEWIKELSKQQTETLSEALPELEGYKATRNTTRMWATIFSVYEHGLLIASNLYHIPGQRGRGQLRYRYDWTTPRLNATQQTPPVKPEEEEKAKYLAALAEMSYSDLTKYRRTKWIVGNIRAAGASERIVEIKLRATAIYFDYA